MSKPPNGNQQRHGHPRMVLALGTMVLIAAIAGTSFFTLRTQRDNTLAAVEANLETRSLSLSEEGNRLFKSVDLVLSSIADYAAREGVNSRESYEARMAARDIHLLLRERLAGMPQADAITIINSRGRLLNFSRYWPIPQVDVSDRDYFLALKGDPTLETFVSKPVQNRGTGTWSIYLARRLNDPDGEFMGLLLGAITLQYFNNMYQATSLGEGSAISLMRQDGVVLAGFPQINEAANAFAKQGPRTVSALASTNAHVTGPSSGNAYRVSARAFADYPLLVAASQDEDVALRNWSAMAELAALISAGGAILVLGAGLMVARWWTKQEHLTHALVNSEHQALQKTTQLETTLANITHALCMFDADEKVVVSNEQFAQIYGLKPEQVAPGTPFRRILEYRIASGLYAGDNPQAYMEEQLAAITAMSDQLVVLNNGRIIAISHKRLDNGGWVSTHMDVTESEKAQEQIKKMARYDALTGLTNRPMLLARLNEAFSHYEVRRERFNLLFLDLDQFKAVNDSLGHPAGDELLKQVAERLTHCTRQHDIVARFGGDEFAILQIFRGDPREAAVILAERLLQSIIRPYDIGGEEVIIGTSIGIALAPEDGANTELLMKNADLALYRAKNGGRNRYEFFHVSMDIEARERRLLEMDLRAAIPRGEFEVFYQPSVSVATRKVASFEALLRWRHPRDGLIMPEHFIPHAEETGLIVPMGEWVLRRACAEARHLPEHIKVAVNLSAVQFGRGDLFATIQSALDDTGFPPERLELEITETVLLQRNEGYLATLKRAKELGISIVLDDFGTGYSSLSYLRMFPFDKIKIDKSFINETSTRPDCAAIVCAVAGLARTLGIQTTAEGIETEEQFLLLRAAGCTFAQGYLFGKAAPVAEAAEALRRECAAA
jgi:diguanylate cyclase (GGDEF)-like protein